MAEKSIYTNSGVNYIAQNKERMFEMSIIISEKPNSIEYDEIYEILFRAHEENRNNNVIVNSRIKNGLDLEGNMKGGKCFVALDNGKAVGTVSALVQNCDRWYYNGKIVVLKFLGVEPIYQGKGIGRLLCKKVEQFAIEQNVAAIELFVVERNPALKMYEKLGYERTDYVARRTLKQFSILMVKWLSEKPSFGLYRKIRYHMKRSMLHFCFPYFR